jgi:hypothetical protein
LRIKKEKDVLLFSQIERGKIWIQDRKYILHKMFEENPKDMAWTHDTIQREKKTKQSNETENTLF